MNLGLPRPEVPTFQPSMQVNFFATFRPIVGTRTVEIPLPEGATVRDLVSEVVRRYPRLGDRLLDEQGQLSKHVHIFVDGRGAPYLRHGMDTTLDANQKIDIFPAVAGGKAAAP